MTYTNTNLTYSNLNQSQILNMLEFAEEINVKFSPQISELKEFIIKQLECQTLDADLSKRVHSLKASISNGYDSFSSNKPKINFAKKNFNPFMEKRAQELFQQALSFHAQKEFKNAFEKYQQASMRGHMGATNNLAALYDMGLGAEKNSKKALELYQEAAAEGYPDSEFNIGLYHEKKQEPAHYKHAANWYVKTTQNPRSLYHLAQMYFKGHGVLQDEETGFSFLEKAVEEGNSEALLMLNQTYPQSKIVFGSKFFEKARILYAEKDESSLTKAFELFKLAASLGEYEAFKELEQIAEEHPSLNSSLTKMYPTLGISREENKNEKIQNPQQLLKRSAKENLNSEFKFSKDS